MIDRIVERIRPKGRLILKDGHRRVVGKVLLKEHLKLLISTSLKERCSHSSNVSSIDASIKVKNFPLADNFTLPLLLGETFAETVSVDLVLKN